MKYNLLIVWQAVDPPPPEFTDRLWGCNSSTPLKMLRRREILKQKRLKKLHFRAFTSNTVLIPEEWVSEGSYSIISGS